MAKTVRGADRADEHRVAQRRAAAARAAQRAGAGFALSTYASNSLEEIQQGRGHAALVPAVRQPGPQKTNELIDLVQAAGFTGRALTVDTQVPSMRERNIRNGYQAPPRITVSNVVDVAWRIGWLKRFLVGPRPAYRNISGTRRLDPEAVRGARLSACPRDRPVRSSWDDVKHFRERWKGPFLLKGVASTKDIQIALDHGINGFIVERRRAPA